MKRLPFIIFGILFSVACNKGKEDIASPEIIILSPERNSLHSISDSLEVRVKISDEDLHNIYIQLEGDSYCCKAIDLKTHSHDLTFNYQRKLLLPEKGVYRLWVRATDHNGNETEVADHSFSMD